MTSYVTLDQLAEQMQVDRRSILRLAQKGGLPAPLKVGKVYRFSILDLEERGIRLLPSAV